MSKEWFPWYPARYRADTMHLTAEQDGIYRRLIDHYMETGLPLMDNDVALARIAGVMADVWAGACPAIRVFFQSRDGKLFSKKCDEILRDQEGRKEANASKALNGANSRWKRANTDKTTRSQRLATARAKGTHTDEQWNDLLESCGYHCCKCGIDAPLVKDHIKPLYQGGSDSIDNIQPLCRKCNSAKGPEEVDYRPKEWLQRLHDACKTSGTRQDNTGKKDTVVDPAHVEEIFDWLQKFLNSPSPLFTAPVSAWLAWGADFDLDIKPVAQRWRKANPQKAIRSLEWFDDDIAASIQKRLKPMPETLETREGNTNGNANNRRKTKSEQADDAMHTALIDLGIAH